MTTDLSDLMEPGGFGRQGFGTSPFGKLRKQISEIFKEPHTCALAYCLMFHAKRDPMLVEDIFEWLDEHGSKSPYPYEDWNTFTRNDKRGAQRLVSKVRATLRKRDMVCNKG